MPGLTPGGNAVFWRQWLFFSLICRNCNSFIFGGRLSAWDRDHCLAGSHAYFAWGGYFSSYLVLLWHKSRVVGVVDEV